MSKEAMKLALEALKFALHVGFDESSESQIKKGDKAVQQHQNAITALREALAEQPAQQQVGINGLTEAETNATASVMGLVEQKVLEHAPCLGMNCGITRTDQMHSAECQAEHAATIAGGKFVKPAQPQQKPGAEDNLNSNYRLDPPGLDPRYTSPPAQRTWQGLTDEEVINVMPDDDTPMSLGEAFSKFAELIEAKLKEKNT